MLVKLPFPEEGRSDKETIQNLYDVVLRLRKELEYQMAHLDSENVTSLDADITEIKNLKAEQIFTNVIESNVAITNVLYASEGRIARLTVDHLLTEDVLLGLETMNYIDIEDQYIKFITATRNDSLPQIQYTDDDDNLLYWDSAEHNYVTTDITDYPTMVYQYDKLTKLALMFEQGETYMIPKIILGAGTGVGENGKGRISKDELGLDIEYISGTDAERNSIEFTDDGIDIKGFQNPITYLNGISQSTLLSTALVLTSTLTYSMKFRDHAFYMLSFQITATANDMLTLEIHKNGVLHRTFYQSVDAGKFEIVNISVPIIAVQPTDTLIEAYVKSANSTLTVSNIESVITSLNMNNAEPYTPDSTKPYDFIDVAALMNITSKSVDITNILASESILDELITPIESNNSDNVSIDSLMNITSKSINITNILNSDSIVSELL